MLVDLQGGQRKWIRFGQRIIHYIPLAEKAFSTSWLLWICFSRHVLSWKLSKSLDTEFCLEALRIALTVRRKPQMFHFDQGCSVHLR